MRRLLDHLKIEVRNLAKIDWGWWNRPTPLAFTRRLASADPAIRRLGNQPGIDGKPAAARRVTV